MANSKKTQATEAEPVAVAVDTAPAPADVAAQLAEMKANYAKQREAQKAERDAALARLKEQKEAMKIEREKQKAVSDAAKEQAKAEREAQKAAKAQQKLIDEQAKLAARAEKDAARLAKEQEKLAKLKEKLENPAKDQNGVTEPAVGTVTRALWDRFSELSSVKSAPVSIAEVFADPVASQQNESTVRTQYARWKRFHGIFGRVASAAPAPAPETAAA